MQKSLLFLTGLLFLLGCLNQRKITGSPDPSKNALSPEHFQLIDTLFQDFTGDRPGATVMIGRGQHLLFSKAYGLINLPEKRPATVDTRYHLASASKQFTAMAILKLIDAGKLNFETKLPEIFPDFPAYGKEISIQHLLTHQSGLPEINQLPAAGEEHLLTDGHRLEQLMAINTLAFPPGTQCAYSNTSYSVLAEIVRKVSGRPFAEFMQQEIFLPAGMTATDFYPNVSEPNTGYHLLADTVQPAPGAGDATLGSGSVYTSIKDYFRWHLALVNRQLVSPELQRKAFTTQEGTENRWGHYGYGWYTMRNDEYDYVEHGGVTQSAGFICFTARIPEQDISVAIFTNRAWSQANPASASGIKSQILKSKLF